MTTQPIFAAVRAMTAPLGRKRRRTLQRAQREGWPELVLLLDTETTVDTVQRLRFGSYRLCRWVEGASGTWQLLCIEEGIFHDDDLDTRAPDDLIGLQRYVRRVFAAVGDGRHARLALSTRREFVEQVLWPAIWRGHALIVGFNLPFDLSRLAVAWGPTRPRGEGRAFARGFSLTLWDRWDDTTRQYVENKFRPRLLIKHEDSKRARMALGRCQGTELLEGTGNRKRWYRGRFLDLKTFAFVLTGQGHSLASACAAFETPHEKRTADYAGPITPAYIDYNRADVQVSQELLEALRAEFDRHPIAVDPWQLHSPASVGKGYLRAMGVTPPLARTRRLPAWVHGAAMEAYYGGRAECHAPRVELPVVYTDFTSMYPTVLTLAHLAQWLTAETLAVVRCKARAVQVLSALDASTVLDPATWPALAFFARVLPADDVLPLRAQYAPGSDAYTIGVNYVTSDMPLWYTGFDLAASVLLTGRVPHILEAYTLEPRGQLAGLRPVQLRGRVTLDPRKGDMFRTLVEARHAVRHDARLSDAERKRLDRALKIVANSTSYGIFAEMNPQDLPPGETRNVQVIGGSEHFVAPSSKPEQPGEFAFPPIAALVTGAARLLLALVEHLVSVRGGTYAFCDTDSLAIVASQAGGTLHVTREDGSVQEVHVLSWQEVARIVQLVDTLNPYGPVVHGTLLKIEDENYVDGTQVQLHAFGISAKRYCLYREP